MRPAYQIALNEKELADLGRLTATLGIVDDEMIKIVAHLLDVSRDTANAIMGSSKISDNASIWTKVISERSADEDVLWLVEIANLEMAAVSKDRNDFIHAIYEHHAQMIGGAMVQGGPRDGSAFMVPTPMGPQMVGRAAPVARRLRSNRPHSLVELPAVVERSARLSCLVAHISHLVIGNAAHSSPWLERLAPSLPPRLDTAEERRARAQPALRSPSQKSLRERRRERRTLKP